MGIQECLCLCLWRKVILEVYGDVISLASNKNGDVEKPKSQTISWEICL